MGKSGQQWTFGWCDYIEISRTLLVRGKRSELRGRPLDVLQLLLTNSDKVLSNELIEERIWGGFVSRTTLAINISKLRKAFGGGIDDVIQNVAGQGYTIAVPVYSHVEDASTLPALRIKPGDPIPPHPEWLAISRLGGPDHGPVWLARKSGEPEQRVYKFATDGIRLGTLIREELVATILGESDTPVVSLRHVEDSNLSTSPYYISGEYVGPSLLNFGETEEFAAMPPRDRISLVRMLAESVASAHALGILHNNLSPRNVLLRQLRATHPDALVQERYAMVLIDFGESSLLDHGLGSSRSRVEGEQDLFDPPGESYRTSGSEMYRPPELRFGGTGTVEADVYALGVILYQTLVGNFQETLSAEWQHDVRDSLLAEDIATAANRDPQKRFRSAAAFAEQLHSLEYRQQDTEQEQTRLRILQMQRRMDRARAARPWIIAAFVTLIIGVLASAWFYRSALLQRNVTQRQNRSLAAMITFLSEDILAQSNPAAGIPGSSQTDLSLTDAILNAAPQIDRRFPHDRMIAGKLRETIADGLRARTDFADADREYATAAKDYREAEGRLSQAAIVVELKREGTKLVGLLPGSMGTARSSFDQQVRLINQLPRPVPMVQVLQDFVESGLIGLESYPAKAVPPLQRAIRRAEATPEFDPSLLMWLKGRYCGLYVRMQDGPHLEAAARERIEYVSGRYGKDSPMLVSYEMYLQEAYYLQNKYKEAIEQADRNYPRFKRLVGDRNQYTVAVLINRAASLAQLGRYREATEDDLKVYALEEDDPSGVRMKLLSLNEAALFDCRSGRYRRGLENARHVTRDAGPGPNFMPEFYDSSKLVTAECLVGAGETSKSADPRALAVAELLLKQVDASMISQRTGDTGYPAFVGLTGARAALLRHDYSRAALELSRADSYFSQPGSDPNELRQYRRVKEVLAQASARK